MTTPPPISPAPSVKVLVATLKASASHSRASALAYRPAGATYRELLARAARLDDLAAALPGIMAAKDRLATAERLLGAFFDTEPCHFDHHGHCHTHGNIDGGCLNVAIGDFLERYENAHD